MSVQPPIIDLPLTLHLSEQARAKVVQRAAAAHTDVAAYVSGLIEQTTKAPQSFDAICGDAQQKFDQTGMTDDQLSELLEKEKHAARNERRARRGA